MKDIIPVILCGGKGSRLWPLSQSNRTKPFLGVFQGETLFQSCVRRVHEEGSLDPIIVVCSREESAIAFEQLRAVGVRNAVILQEPVSRNTAPAATIAALFVKIKFGDRQILVLPADQLISDIDSFKLSVQIAAQSAKKGHIVTFGKRPTHPHTGFGYIKATQVCEDDSSMTVEKFVEKPSLKKAKFFVQNNGYWWNCGIFAFTASSFLDEMERFRPDILQHCIDALQNSNCDENRVDVSSEFSECIGESIDYAVMEKTKKAVLVPLHSPWSDVGSWEAVHELSVQDESGNTALGNVVALDSRGSYLRSEHRFVAAIGLKNIIVIETENAVLVADRERSQDVKEIVALLARSKDIVPSSTRQFLRPWGYYEVIFQTPTYQVKKLFIHPSAQISLQLHKHRCEHWVVVAGQAEAICGDEKSILEANQSIFIPRESKHRLRNIGDKNLIVIEVQYGTYLGEDDIVRFSDDYGRVGVEAIACQ